MKFYRRYNGFTLVELLIVVAIIGLLSAVIVPSIFQSRARGRDAEVRTQVQVIKLALARVAQADPNGKYPGSVSTWYCLKTTAGPCSNASLSASKSDTLNAAILQYFPGRAYPQAQGAVSGQYRYNAYVYNPSDSTKISGYNGPVLLWWQEKVILPADCNGTLPGSPPGNLGDAGVYYCYERLLQ